MTPELEARLHKWLTFTWLAAALPICLLLSNSVPFLVFISVYAVAVGHWSGWNSARGEVHSPDEEEVQRLREDIAAGYVPPQQEQG